MVKKLDAKETDLGAFMVRRTLPNREQRLIGPFIFFDHMGPAEFEAGRGIDVAPHPHIGLATLTYLFEGSILHRDSLGSNQEIKPGEVNWMIAGSGIVHSERESDAVRNSDHRLDGLQLWVALPEDQQEIDPAFHHFPASSLPVFSMDNIDIRLMVGQAFGHSSPVPVHSPIFYMDMEFNAHQDIPLPGNGSECGLYMMEGSMTINGEAADAQTLYYIGVDEDVTLRAEEGTRLIMLGGVPFETHRHVYWNFVSTDRDRIETAKEDWVKRDFPTVPGDDGYIPLPGKVVAK